MFKTIHKACYLQVSTSEAAALIEKVMNEVRSWGSYKIDRTGAEGAYASFACTPIWTFSLYHNSFIPEAHITVYEDNGNSQICFDFTLCKSVKFVDVLINSFLLLFAISISVLAASGKCDLIYAFASIVAYLLLNTITLLVFHTYVSMFYKSITSEMRQVDDVIK